MIFGVLHADVAPIASWLLGINFTVALFSVNFTFFGYQLAKYKAIYSEITKRQWFNLTCLLLLPFVPLIAFLVSPNLFGATALLLLPVLVLSAVDNAELTLKSLNPVVFLRECTTEKEVSRYLLEMSEELKGEIEEHDCILKSNHTFQVPLHARSFHPRVLGAASNDLWDDLALVSRLSIENGDYSVFRASLKSMLHLLFVSYAFASAPRDDYRLGHAVMEITRKRFRSAISSTMDMDKSGIFLQSLANELCDFMLKGDFSRQPCSDMARAVASDSVWVGSKMLESTGVVEPIQVLNCLHRVVENGIHRLETGSDGSTENSLEKYNISAYAHDIKDLGVSALHSGNFHFAYRSMETLSYLGCNAAAIGSTQTIVSVFESIVQLGRLARHLGIGCFWSRCLIPAESHAEEFMGHILTWLVQDVTPEGGFRMKGHAEQAYSRLRGVKCVIRPKAGMNPCFWIEELERSGNKVPHVEYESGMYGYGGQLDYLDYSNLKEYALHGIGSETTPRIIKGAPIPLDPASNK